MELPPDTFVEPGTHDPLRHTCADLFWYHVEPVSACPPRTVLLNARRFDVCVCTVVVWCVLCAAVDYDA